MEEITHKWSIIKLVQNYDETKTVKTVHYRVTSFLSELSIFSDGSVDLNPPSENNFIQYENLKEEDVLLWVFDILGPSLGNHEISNSTWLQTKRSSYQDRIIEPLPW